jgi:hypothetical protein
MKKGRLQCKDIPTEPILDIRCKTCSELCDTADGENRCYNPLNSGIGDSDQSIYVDPETDFCSYHSKLRHQ